MSFDFDGGVGSLEAAAVLAALAVFEDELTAARSVPAPRPVQGAWVMSGRPREVTSPFADETDGLRRSPAPPT